MAEDHRQREGRDTRGYKGSETLFHVRRIRRDGQEKRVIGPWHVHWLRRVGATIDEAAAHQRSARGAL